MRAARRIGLLVMILVMAFLDMVGVVSIMPFMAVLANPAGVQANPWLTAVYVLVPILSDHSV